MHHDHEPSSHRRRAGVHRLVMGSVVFAVAGTLSALGAAGTAAAATGTNPASNVPPSSSTLLVAVNSARAGEGVSPMPVQLAGLQSVPVPEQVFVLTNLERTGRGLPPIQGMLASLNASAQAGANTGSDPTLTTTATPTTWWGSIWAGGTNSALQADYGWMYLDGPGPGGENLDCTAAGQPGCWGHRDNILHVQTQTCAGGSLPTYFMGAANDPTYPITGQEGSTAAIIIATCTPSAWTAKTAETVSWPQAMAATGVQTGQPPAPAFSTFTRIAGQTADATAAAELSHQFASGTCPGATGTRPVVVATDATYPDALASAYLARSLGTGTLLTPTGSLSSATETAIRTEGITQVDVVGGPLAISTAVVGQLEALPAYACGGGAPLATGKKVQVTRIWGQSQYTTAEDIAEKVPATHVGSVDLAGAYAGVNNEGGDGAFNDTSGSASTGAAASGAMPTAIVATGQGFQDAEAASTLAYADSLPILLTTPSGLSAQTSAAITTLGIKQVIVMGGPLAVSNAVVSGLEGRGVSVIRVAGQTYGDTSVQLATLETAPAGTGFGWTGTGGLTAARGNGFTDGLAGAVVAADGPDAGSPEPLVLTTSPTAVGTALAAFLKTAGTTGIGGAKVTHFTILGGTLAITQTTINDMGADL